MKNIKQILRDWVIPPKITTLINSAREQPKNGQKYWNGEPVNAAALEENYFKSLGFQPMTLTRQDDTRCAIRITQAIKLAIPDTNNTFDFIQLAVVTDEWPENAALKIFNGSKWIEYTHLKSIHWSTPEGRWFDIRVPVEKNTKYIEIKTDQPIFLTMPRSVETRKQQESSRNTQQSIKHVIVIVIDGLCRRVISKHHPTAKNTPSTPNLDHFFSEGLHATNGISSAEWTLPTVASIFTGWRTSKHKTFHPSREQFLPTECTTLPEIFQKNGFKTVCLSAVSRVTPAFGHHRGFDRFLYHWAYEGHTYRNYETSHWISEIIGHLDVHKNDKTFTYVQFPDTHPAWNIPPLTRAFNLARQGSSPALDLEELKNHEDRLNLSIQIENLRHHELDRELGGLFSFIENNINDETLVILTQDHGSPWKDFRPERPEFEPTLVYDRTHIDFKIRGPQVPNTTYEEVCSPNIDIMPTIMNLMGFQRKEAYDGQDIISLPKRKTVVSESVFNNIYEIAVSSLNHTLYHQYNIDDQLFKIDKNPLLKIQFPFGTTNYRFQSEKIDQELTYHLEQYVKNLYK